MPFVFASNGGADIAEYLDWYNAQRAHSSLGDLTPNEHYFAHLQPMAKAA